MAKVQVTFTQDSFAELTVMMLSLRQLISEIRLGIPQEAVLPIKHGFSDITDALASMQDMLTEIRVGASEVHISLNGRS